MAADLDIRLDGPEAVKLFAPNAMTLTYTNPSTNDVRLPVVLIESTTGGRLDYLYPSPNSDDSLTLIPPAVVPGLATIPPGGTGHATILYTPTAEGAGDLEVHATSFDDQSLRGLALDWDTIIVVPRPDGVSDADWDAHVAAERDRYGETYADLFDGFLTNQIAELGAKRMRDAAFVKAAGCSHRRPPPASPGSREAGCRASTGGLRLQAPAQVYPRPGGDDVQTAWGAVVSTPSTTCPVPISRATRSKSCSPRPTTSAVRAVARSTASRVSEATRRDRPASTISSRIRLRRSRRRRARYARRLQRPRWGTRTG